MPDVTLVSVKEKIRGVVVRRMVVRKGYSYECHTLLWFWRGRMLLCLHFSVRQSVENSGLDEATDNTEFKGDLEGHEYNVGHYLMFRHRNRSK